MIPHQTINSRTTRIWEGASLPPLHLAAEPPKSRYTWRPEVPLAAPPARAAAATAQPWLKQLTLAVWMVLLSVLGYLLISRHVITAVEIQGRSMAPTLQDGERYFLNRLAYRWRAPARGELAVIRDPGHADCAVKRIIGLPGEQVAIRDGRVWINGQKLAEPYLPSGLQTRLRAGEAGEVKLGPECYFLLGDNRGTSEDSRTYGPIHRRQIIGLIAK